MYIIGRQGSRGRYRILKLDRTLAPPILPCCAETIASTPAEDLGLHIHDDGILYTQRQVASVLKMLEVGNDSVKRVCTCDVLIGITRFVESYYLVAVIQSTQVAALGPHQIYRIDETRLIPIANPALVKFQRRPEEAQYLAAFQAIALQQDLYYSHTYDVTKTLQRNVLVQALAQSRSYSSSLPRINDGEDAAQLTGGSDWPLCGQCRKVAARSMGATGVAPSSLPICGMFTWNAHLLEVANKVLDRPPDPLEPDAHAASPWFVPIIQGFCGQVKISVLGRPIFLTLIARRSRHFAGARFLRRGADSEGWVANEVESEQIVHDGSQAQFPDLEKVQQSIKPTAHYAPATPVDPLQKFIWENVSDADPSSASSSMRFPFHRVCVFCHGHCISSDGTVRIPYPPGPVPRVPPYTSFVQHRGSIPLLWSQDSSAMAPKPPISLNIRDPFFVVASQHINRMLENYGAPVIVFNLIKTREKVKREAILGAEFEICVKYLNQFLPKEEHIEYNHVDMSREKKTGRVIDILEKDVEEMVDKVGYFSCVPEPILQAKNRDDGEFILARIQNGVIRTNCIDCLDRTNAAAFVIGKSALSRQLVQLGVLKTAKIPFDTEAIDLLMDLYQSHGDAIALQYGGSALVNTMKTYRQPTDFVAQGRDMLETIKRYYNNSFTDSEKQDAIDIFLGIYRGWEGFRLPLNSQHHKLLTTIPKYTQWRQHQNEALVTPDHPPSSDLLDEPEGYISLANMSGTDCPTSLSATPFKVHPMPDAPMFDLSGLKQWLSSRKAESTLPRERTSSVSSFFGSFTEPDVLQDTVDIRSMSASSPALNASSKFKRHSLDVTPASALSPRGESITDRGKSPENEALDGLQGGDGKVKKKAIEALVEKLLNPEISQSELREYRRYVNQFTGNSLQLVSYMPLVESEQGNNRAHPDYDLFLQHSRLATGDVFPDVSNEDHGLYEAYVDLPMKVLQSDFSNAWQERVVAYEGWLNTGRYKGNPKTPRRTA